MKTNYLLLLLLLVITSCSNANKSGSSITSKPDVTDPIPLPDGKEIYIPAEFKDMDFQNPDSKWSYHRMACTDNFVIFWEKGFGADLSNPPALEGKPMKVDLENLKEKLESFYRFFKEDLKFIQPGSNADRYRMMVMINYSLEGTAYGGDYDGVIGALWIAPNRVQDAKLNCIAHELGHSFQAQISCDKAGEAWGGCGFFEMTSQWMLWHVNPDWPTDEQYHWDAFGKNAHKAFLHLTNIYRSPYVLEYWSQHHGLTYIGDLFRAGRKGEDPAMTHIRLQGLSQEQFCDEMFEASRRIVNLDFTHAYAETRRHAGKFSCTMEPIEEGWYRSAKLSCPENYGFNAIELSVPAGQATVSVDFRGEAGLAGYRAVNADKAGWRYGFVAVDSEGRCHYSDAAACRPDGEGRAEGSLSYTLPAGKTISRLWLVVMGAPTEHWKNIDSWEEGDKAEDAQWPYSVKFAPDFRIIPA